MQSVREGTTWMLRLDAGEPLVETLGEWARRERIQAASVLAGIGMVRDTEIGYYRGTAYDKATFPEPLELLGLAGSIAWEEDRPSLHLHLLGGRGDHTTVGGHLFGTTVAVLAEITVQVFPGHRFRRPPVPGTVLRALSLVDDAQGPPAPAGGPRR
ncbi:MAG TPA: PPC domain-containing DNA-binding protein [Thermoplasmata archaeon]|nr:PPC domain-containing DNA-binding protein [Thermoplasmata archaeon]